MSEDSPVEPAASAEELPAPEKPRGRGLLGLLLKLGVTLAIFGAIFAEFGGGPHEVPTELLSQGSHFERSNPAMPGLVGKLKARLSGTELPVATVPVPASEVCRAGAEGAVFLRVDDELLRFKPLRHCQEDRFLWVYASDGKTRVGLEEEDSGSSWLLLQGHSLVPMDMVDLWAEIKSVELAVFLPWFLFAIAIKLLGIFANIYRWHVLLVGQGIRLNLRYLTSTYFVGRYFGIVTPSTMGLDGWRLYDTIVRTRKPVECTTAVVVERVIGLVGLLTVILLFMPLADLEGRSLGELAAAMKLPLLAAVIFALLVLLRPEWFARLPRLIPIKRVAVFAERAIESATAYSSCRRYLLIALACAIFGQLTTMAMYFGNAMALQVEGVTAAQVLYASAVMTLGTFLAPSASGEGVRELVFVALLGDKTTAAKAFLIGHLGFWIEKLPLSIPGAWLLFRQPEDFHRITQADLERVRAGEGLSPETAS